jgi:hypothetical protein
MLNGGKTRTALQGQKKKEEECDSVRLLFFFFFYRARVRHAWDARLEAGRVHWSG